MMEHSGGVGTVGPIALLLRRGDQPLGPSMSRYEDERFNERVVRCRDRALTAWACASLLRPDLNAARKKKLAKKILKMAEGKDHRLGITSTQAQEIVLSHTQCLAKPSCSSSRNRYRVN